MTAFVLALTVELHLPASRSLKDKRASLRSIIEGARRRFGVAGAETGHQDSWQRAELCFAVVAGSVGHASEVIDSVERFVWSFTEAEVTAATRHWLEVDP
ncbi:MAG: DUF503 domain-containing protein [Acidimicrobiales bacterium]